MNVKNCIQLVSFFGFIAFLGSPELVLACKINDKNSRPAANDIIFAEYFSNILLYISFQTFRIFWVYLKQSIILRKAGRTL